MRIDLREASWFGRERATAYAVILVIAFLPTFAWFYRQAMGPVGSDFLAFWSAAKLAAAGQPAAAYDFAALARVQGEFGAGAIFPFINPPPYLLLILPLGLLPYAIAWPLWVALTYALWLLLARRLLPGATWPIAAFPGAVVAAWHAQNGFVTASLFIAAFLSFRAKRPWLAGAFLGALIVKPHLALLVPIALLGGREWRAVLGAATSAAALLLLSWAAFGTGTFVAFWHSTATSASLLDTSVRLQSGDQFYLRMTTLYAGAKLLAGNGAALVVQGLAAAIMAGIVYRAWDRRLDPLAKASVLIIATCLATPYLFHYDLPVLIVPILWLAREGLRTGFLPWEKAALAFFYWASFLARALAPWIHFNIMPLVLLGMLWAAWRRLRSTEAPAEATRAARVGELSVE